MKEPKSIKITSITQASKLVDALDDIRDKDIRAVVEQLYDIMDEENGLRKTVSSSTASSTSFTRIFKVPQIKRVNIPESSDTDAANITQTFKGTIRIRHVSIPEESRSEWNKEQKKAASLLRKHL